MQSLILSNQSLGRRTRLYCRETDRASKTEGVLMRKCVWICSLLLASSAVFGGAAGRRLADGPDRVVQNFDFGWKFLKGEAQDAEKIDFDDSQWRDADVPHDWSIEGPFAEDSAGGAAGGYLPLGIGWYRKEFKLDSAERLKKVFVEFDGVYKNSDVWINGQHLGKRWYGYASFHYDLTQKIDWDGKNCLAVRVDNSKQTCRWYSGSGIYRHVRLVITPRLHVG